MCMPMGSGQQYVILYVFLFYVSIIVLCIPVGGVTN